MPGAPLPAAPPSLRVSGLKWRLAQWLEVRWWRRYLRHREPGAYLAWKRTYWRSFLERVGVAVPPGARVLDAGCGPAGIFTVLPAAEVVAVDPLLGAYARLPVMAAARTPRIRFEAAELERLDETDFEYVFCLNVVNHVRDLGAVLRVLAQALRPGGTAVISVDAHRYRLTRGLFRAVPGDALHPHQLSLGEYAAAVASAGLTVQRCVLVERELLFDYVALVCSRKTGSRQRGSSAAR